MNAQVEPLSQRRIERHLRQMGLRALQAPEGHSMVLLRTDEGSRVMALVVVAADGTSNQVLSVVAKIEGALQLNPKDLLERANAWNKERRWPRVFVREGELYADYHVDLEKGVTEEQLRNFLDTAFLGLDLFLRWLEGRSEPDLGSLLRRLLGR